MFSPAPHRVMRRIAGDLQALTETLRDSNEGLYAHPRDVRQATGIYARLEAHRARIADALPPLSPGTEGTLQADATHRHDETTTGENPLAAESAAAREPRAMFVRFCVDLERLLALLESRCNTDLPLWDLGAEPLAERLTDDAAHLAVVLRAAR